jgi:hypothetical protein
MGSTHRRLFGLALVTVLAFTGCAVTPDGSGSTDVSPGGSASAIPAGSPTVAIPTTAPKKAVTGGDLKNGAVKRTFMVSGLTVNVDYSTPLAIGRWSTDISKPLNVSLTAFANSSHGQKIYLARVRANIGVSDGSNQLDPPEPLVDIANITPGFIVTFPYRYGQVFVIPAVDSGAKVITVDFSYEFLLQVAPNARDYSKQTARDTLVIPLS